MFGFQAKNRKKERAQDSTELHLFGDEANPDTEPLLVGGGDRSRRGSTSSGEPSTSTNVGARSFRYEDSTSEDGIYAKNFMDAYRHFPKDEKAKQIAKAQRAMYIKLQAPSKLLGNERTALRWIERSLDVGFMGTFLMTFFVTQEGAYIGMFMWCVAIVFMTYAVYRFWLRGETLTGARVGNDPDDPFDAVWDNYGPVILACTLGVCTIILVVYIAKGTALSGSTKHSGFFF